MTMLPELSHLDAKTAAGILARTALFLQSDGVNPAAEFEEPSEQALRTAIIERARSAVGDGPQSGELMLDWIDQELESATGTGDDAAALERLSAEAALPSDIYQVDFANDFLQAESFLNFGDRDIVKNCIKSPDMQEDFGADSEDTKPTFVSIFGKWHGLKIDRNHFLLVVVCERHNLKFLVRHYWRIYPADVVLYPLKDLIDALSKFASVYGSSFKINDWEGKFLYQRNLPDHSTTFKLETLPQNNPKDQHIAIAIFRQVNGTFRAAIGIGINLSKYKRAVLKHDKFSTKQKLIW